METAAEGSRAPPLAPRSQHQSAAPVLRGGRVVPPGPAAGAPAEEIRDASAAVEGVLGLRRREEAVVAREGELLGPETAVLGCYGPAAYVRSIQI
jgi:hypothetical protein